MLLRKFIQTYYIPVLAFLTLLASINFYNDSRKNVIWSDQEGYYSYLPALFILNGFEDVPNISGQFPKYEGTDKTYTKYTCGVAFLELPFFLLTQFVCFVLDKDMGGYTSLNNFGLRLAGIFYCMAGLYILKRLLEKVHSKTITLLAIVIIYAGTNLFYYTAQEAGMSHVYSFFLFAAFVLFTHSFYQNPGFLKVVKLGAVFGLIVLIRPTNAILVLYFLLHDVYSWQKLKERVSFLWKRIHWFLIVPVIVFLIFIPQFIYWKYISGNFIIYSYNEEGFKYWREPRVINMLFDVKNGWIVYTPLVIFLLLSIIYALKKKVANAPVVAIIILISAYVFASWWSWWFGGALGYRSFVEFYALMIFPFAYLLKYLSETNILVKTVATAAFLACISYNIFVSHLHAFPWRHPYWNEGMFEDKLKQYFPASPETF